MTTTNTSYKKRFILLSVFIMVCGVYFLLIVRDVDKFNITEKSSTKVVCNATTWWKRIHCRTTYTLFHVTHRPFIPITPTTAAPTTAAPTTTTAAPTTTVPPTTAALTSVPQDPWPMTTTRTNSSLVELPNTNVSNTSSIRSNGSDSVPFPDRIGKPITILFHNNYFGSKSWEMLNLSLSSCPEMEKTCRFSYNQADLSEADLVFVHMRNGYKNSKNRPAFQKWVFSVQESPINTHVNTKALRNDFNLTMTYRLDSTFQWSYGICEAQSPPPPPPPPQFPPVNYNSGKKHMVAWFVGNCRVSSQRSKYIDELSKHIEVHKFGCGGKYSCPRSKQEYCDKVLLNNDYRFYMSFENTFCKGYVTEKTFRILNLNVIPVVSGLANYSQILPQNSFINVKDFDTPRDLANHLRAVATDDRRFNEYFAWKLKGIWRCYPPTLSARGCAICSHALRHRQIVETVDIDDFWQVNKNCISADEFYKGHW